MKKQTYCLFEEDYFKKKRCSKKTCENYETCSRKNQTEKYLPELLAQEEERKKSNVHSVGELAIMQNYPLETKIRLTRERIEAWYEYWYGRVYISFSGGKDSTVLLDLVRNVCGFTDVPAVFVDTGLEYPEIRDFVSTFDNVVWLKPDLNFKQVISKYGYPFPSKEVSFKTRNARKYLENLQSGKYGENIPCYTHMADFLNIDKRPGSEELKLLKEGKRFSKNSTYAELKEIADKDREQNCYYNKTKWLPLLFAPMKISEKCCQVMKKSPTAKYEKKTNRRPYLGQLAEESAKRKAAWEKTGCNAFYSDRPQSNPMAFWTEQDILLYIKTRELPICSVYGEVVEDISNTEEVEGQLSFSDIEGYSDFKEFDATKPKLKTTGCVRTGCMFCGYGCHLNDDQRFVTMKDTHPKQYEYIMKPTSEGGLGYKEVIDWINENCETRIKY